MDRPLLPHRSLHPAPSGRWSWLVVFAPPLLMAAALAAGRGL